MSTAQYEMIVGRRYHKLARKIGNDRSVVAFFDPNAGRWYEAKSWSQRGRMCNAQATNKYRELARIATYGESAP